MKSEESSASSKVEAVPNGMHTVTPHLVCAGVVEAIEFYTRAFGAHELCRIPGPNGKMIHASVRIGDSMVMLVDEMAEWGALGPKALGGTAVTIHLQVEDADALFAKAVSAGAEVKMPIEDAFWGDRYGMVKDPFGHHWSIATHVRDISPDDIAKASESACCQG